MKGWVTYFKPWLGYIWLITALLVSVTGLVNQKSLMEFLIIKRGFKVTENWSGGKIDSVIVHDGYRTIIHQPVFEGLLAKSKRGFIRIVWASNSELELPLKISEAVDYNHDGRMDFKIRLNTADNVVDFHSYQGRNLTFASERVLVFGKSRSLRINITQ